MNEQYQHRNSPVHVINPLVKIIFTLGFMVCIALMPSGVWLTYGLFIILIISIVQVSQIGVGFVLKRGLIALPFVLAALPLIFTGPPPKAQLTTLLGNQLAYSPQGVIRFLSIAIKSWISMQSAIVLTTTTQFRDILLGLQQLKVPKMLIAILGLMWRYLFVLRDEVVSMINARASRSAVDPRYQNSGGTVFWRAKVTGGMVGSLFLRSIERSERVYAAMLSRGYTGELPPNTAEPLKGADIAVLLAGLALLGFVMMFTILTGR